MNTSDFFLQQQLDRFQQECRTKRQQVLRSEDVFEIARIVDHTTPPGIIAFMKTMMTERRSMISAAEQRARDLVQEMIDGKRAHPKEGLYPLYRVCAGRLPEAARLVDRLMRQERSATAPTTSTPGNNPGP